jgi:hypothetical protein
MVGRDCHRASPFAMTEGGLAMTEMGFALRDDWLGFKLQDARIGRLGLVARGSGWGTSDERLATSDESPVMGFELRLLAAAGYPSMLKCSAGFLRSITCSAE